MKQRIVKRSVKWTVKRIITRVWMISLLALNPTLAGPLGSQLKSRHEERGSLQSDSGQHQEDTSEATSSQDASPKSSINVTIDIGGGTVLGGGAAALALQQASPPKIPTAVAVQDQVQSQAQAQAQELMESQKNTLDVATKTLGEGEKSMAIESGAASLQESLEPFTDL